MWGQLKRPEGLLYLQKYGIGGSEFGITERRISNRKGKAASMPVQEQGGWLGAARPLNHPLASGFTRERGLLHPTTALTPSTNELLTGLKIFHLFNFKTYKDHFTNSLTKELNIDLI